MTAHPRHGRRAGIGSILLAFTLLAGCGIGAQDSADRINPAQLGALGTTPDSEPSPSTMAPAPTTTLPQPIATTSTTLPDVRVRLYYVDGDRIEEVTRTLPGGTSVRAILGLLTQPPEGPNLRTTITPDLVGPLYRRGSLETVDLDSEVFNAVDPLEQPLLFAQLVLTLTALPEQYSEVDSVQFTLDGAPLRAMRGDNTLAELGAAVTAGDYHSLLDG